LHYPAFEQALFSPQDREIPEQARLSEAIVWFQSVRFIPLAREEESKRREPSI